MVYNVKKLFDVFFQLKREGYKEVEMNDSHPGLLPNTNKTYLSLCTPSC